MNCLRIRAAELFSLLFLLLLAPAAAQEAIDHETKDLLSQRNYGSAILRVEELLEKNPDHPLLNYYAGLCYLHSRSQKQKAAAYLEKAIEHSQWWRTNARPKTTEAPADAHKLLGDAYYFSYKFDAAVIAYEKYRSLNAREKNDPLAAEVAVKTEMCRYLTGFKPEASLPLSAHTGSPCADLIHGTMTSSLSADKSVMTYVLRVPMNKLQKHSGDASFYEQITLPPLKDSASRKQKVHQRKKHLERDSVVYAATVGTSYDGQVMLTYKNDNGDGNLYISRLRDNKWTTPGKMKKIANDAGWESYESLSADGKTLYFVSDRQGGYGGNDIYKCTLQPDGQWSKAVNLGPSVNTEGDEVAPFIHADGTTLYFSSNRLRPGSFDIFAATASVANNWSQPRNVGYPINRNEQDIFQVDADRKRIFGSSPAGMQRPGGDTSGSQHRRAPDLSGSDDNYLITFTGQQGEFIHLRRGKVEAADTDKPLAATIQLIDNVTGAEIGRCHTDSETGEFSVILSANKDLQAVFTAPGYLPYSERANLINDQNYFEEQPVIRMEAAEAGSSYTLNNVFFDENNTKPDKRSRHELDRIARLLKENQGMKAEITAMIFTPEHKKFYKRLAKERSRNIVSFLENEGINKRRISADWDVNKPPKEKSDQKNEKKKKSRIKKREPVVKEKVKPIQITIFTISELE